MDDVTAPHDRMKPIFRAYDFGAYHLATMVFFAVSLALNLLCAIGLALPMRRRLAKPVRSVLATLFRLVVGMMRVLRIARIELPAPARPSGGVGRIWVMNHPSILDGCYALNAVPRGAFIYKTAIGLNPFYGSIARLADYIPNEGGPDLIRTATERLRRGEDIVVFPDGTRRTLVDPERFKSGFALIAKRAGAQIHALWLDNPPDFLTREAVRWAPPPLPVSLRIVELGVFEAQPGESAVQLGKRVASVYEAQLKKVEQRHDSRAAIPC